LFVFVQFLDDLDRIIAVQLDDDRRQILDAQHFADLIANRFVQFGQDVRIETVAQDVDDVGPVIGAEVLHQVGRVGRVKFRNQLTNAGLVAGDKHLQKDLLFLGFKVEHFFLAGCLRGNGRFSFVVGLNHERVPYKKRGPSR